METILITGANRGIGLEFARQYSEKSWRILACCRSFTNIDELKQLKATNNNIEILHLDVADVNQINQLASDLKNESIDILLNNAGTWGPHTTTLDETYQKEWQEVFRINAMATFFLAQAFLPQVARSNRKIIAAISSGMASIGNNTEGGSYIYRSSKAALNSVIKSLSLDLKASHIIVLALDPGWVKTRMGGEQAPLEAEYSVNQMRKLLASVTLAQSGQFLKYDGRIEQW